jgi:DNA-binding response OmpR family regulator
LYIVDLDLPDTDGIALGRVLLNIHAAPIILVSAFAEAIKHEALTVAAQGYIPKPLDPDYVAEVIRRTLA